MASKTAILSVRIISDASGAAAGFKTAEQHTREFESALDTAAIASGVLLAGITAAAWKAVDAASQLQQSGGAMAAVFGSHADEIGKLAEQAATRVGLAQSEYQQMAAVLGAQMRNLGIDEANLVGQTDELITMGADLAAVFNGTTSEAVNALSALMRGERDPIERFGVTIKQAAVNAKLAEQGMDGLDGKARTTAEAYATLELLAEQTGFAHGKFAEELDSAAVASQVAKAQWEDASAALGTALLPLVSEVAQHMAGLAQTYADNADVLVPLTLIIGGLAAAIAILILAVKAYEAITKLAAAAQVIWNVAMTANPIGLLIAVIVLLIGFIVLIAMNWEEVQVIWGEAIDSMIGWIEDLINWVIDAINWIGKLFGAAGNLGHVDFSGGAQPQALAASTEEPMMFARTFASPTAAPANIAGVLGGGSGGASIAPTVVNEYHVEVNGALDADAVARQLRKMLSDLGRSTGTVVAGGAQWNPSTSR